MKAYIARQPIFNKDYQVVGYELLYRDEKNQSSAAISDGNTATSRLLSDAMTVFGLRNLTDQKSAFVNFTETLIKSDFALLAKPDEIVVEVLEDVNVDDEIIIKLKELKEKGYCIALDDYVGSKHFNEILPLIDILKVDFMLTSKEQQTKFTKLLPYFPNIRLLAEKVETKEEFERAVAQGYSYFQGYYFEKPSTVQKEVPKISLMSYNRLMMELNKKEDIDFVKCARIIKQDASLTFRLLQMMRTLKYYRGQQMIDVQMALVKMGQQEVRRWLMLLLLRDNNITNSEELVQRAFIRGNFGKCIIEKCDAKADSDTGFIIGMFSLIDKIMGRDMEQLMSEIEVPHEIKDVLLSKNESVYSRMLECVISYEDKSRTQTFKDFGFNLNEEDVWKMYMECIIQTDEMLRE